MGQGDSARDFGTSESVENAEREKGIMDTGMKERVYRQYVDDTIERFYNLSLIIAIGEFCLMLLDFQSGFFDKARLNRLNLLAEVLIIGGSLLVYLYCRAFKRKPEGKAENNPV